MAGSMLYYRFFALQLATRHFHLRTICPRCHFSLCAQVSVRICPRTIRWEPDRTIQKTSTGFCSGRKNENQNPCLASSMRCIEQRGPERRIQGLRLLTSMFVHLRALSTQRAVITIYRIMHSQPTGVFRRRSPLSQGNRAIDLPELGRLLAILVCNCIKKVRFPNLDRCLNIHMVRW